MAFVEKYVMSPVSTQDASSVKTHHMFQQEACFQLTSPIEREDMSSVEAGDVFSVQSEDPHV